MANEVRLLCVSLFQSFEAEQLSIVGLAAATRVSSKYAAITPLHIRFLLAEIARVDTHHIYKHSLGLNLCRLAGKRPMDFDAKVLETMWQLTAELAGTPGLSRPLGTLLRSLACLVKFSMIDQMKYATEYGGRLLKMLDSHDDDANEAANLICELLSRYGERSTLSEQILDAMKVVDMGSTYRARNVAMLRLVSCTSGEAQVSIVRTLLGDCRTMPSESYKRDTLMHMACLILKRSPDETQAAIFRDLVLMGRESVPTDDFLDALIESAGVFPLEADRIETLTSFCTTNFPKTAWRSYLLGLKLFERGLFAVAGLQFKRVRQCTSSVPSVTWLQILISLCDVEAAIEDRFRSTASGDWTHITSTLRRLLFETQFLPFGSPGSPIQNWIHYRLSAMRLYSRFHAITKVRAPGGPSLLLLHGLLDDMQASLKRLAQSTYAISPRDRALLEHMSEVGRTFLSHPNVAVAVPRFVHRTATNPFSVEISTDPAWRIVTGFPSELLRHIALTVNISVQYPRNSHLPAPSGISLGFGETPDWSCAEQITIMGRISTDGIIFGRWSGIADLQTPRLQVALRNPQTMTLYVMASVKMI